MKALLRGLLLTMCMMAHAQEFDPLPMNLDPLTLDAVDSAAYLDASKANQPQAEEEDYAEEVEPEEALDVPRDQTRVTVLG